MGLLIGLGTTTPKFAYDYYYGIEWDVTVSNPSAKRIGKMELHQSLPVQSKMRRCLLNDDGTVNYYLNPNDSTKRDNGSAALLDGTDGQVMVELPDVYIRFEIEGNKRRCLMSEFALPGFIKWPKHYVSAYEATVERATNKLASVVNSTPAYRGGTNQAGWDDLDKTQLGRPATKLSLTKLRAYARNRGSVEWNCYLYQSHRELFWLFAVEYATFNAQDTFNAALDSNGYKQGGLGACVSAINNSKWWNYNFYGALIPCGLTNSIGNNTGFTNYLLPPDLGTASVQVPSYRGVENPIGDLHKIVDGCRNIHPSTSDGLIEFYVCDKPENFTSSGVDNYELRGNMPFANGYIKEIYLGESGDIVPLSIGAGSTTYFCGKLDIAKGQIENNLFFGGSADSNSKAGFASIYTSSTATEKDCSRLCFMPNSK